MTSSRISASAFDAYLASILVRARERVARFVESAAGDAFLALEASDDIFEAAATEHVNRIVMARMAGGGSMEQIIEDAKIRALRSARWPHRSTSITCNLTHQSVGAAWAEIAAFGGGP